MFEDVRRGFHGQIGLNLLLKKEMFVENIEGDLDDRRKLICTEQIENFVG